jgi:hypothetical protein
MTDRDEPPPSALAHGPVKNEDIERVRRQVDESGARVAGDIKASAARQERELRREAERRRESDS